MTTLRRNVPQSEPRPDRSVVTLLLGLLIVLSTSHAATAGKPTKGGAPPTPNPLAEQPGAKIVVDREGWYRVSRQDLANAGWDPGSSPTNLQLWADGQEVAIEVNTGADGSLDPADTVEFFGTPLDTPSTGKRVYWLVRGSSAGARVSTYSSSHGKAGPASFDDTVALAPRTMFAPAITSGRPDGFYGPMVTSASVSVTLTAHDVVSSPSGSATLGVSLQGLSWYDHLVEVSLNGHFAGSLSFFGQSAPTSSFSVPDAWVVPGANAVTLTARYGSTDTALLVSTSLTYGRA